LGISTYIGAFKKALLKHYHLIAASENDSTTVVEFSRDAVLVGTVNYVQFKVRLHSNKELVQA